MSAVESEGARADARIAAEIAAAAGELLLQLRASSLADGTTASGNTADVDANDLITARLRAAFPSDAILSEEAEDTDDRAGAERVWIVDPLDGTREYNEAGRGDWAVHIALWASGSLRAGAVALPTESVVFSTAEPVVRPEREAGPVRMVVSRSRPSEEARRVAEALGATLVPMGSAGAKAMAVVRGHVDAYVHAGGQWEWDSAAPIAVAGASGLFTSRLDGSPFIWNQPSPWQPNLVICRAELAPAILAALNDGS